MAIIAKSKVIVLPVAVAVSENLNVPVFPCRPDKKPYTDSGFKNATTDRSQIIEWWTQYPDALIGMPTGAKSGYSILDVDDRDGSDGKPPKDGSDSLAKLEQEYGKLPDTWEVLTPSGSRHFWFKYPDKYVKSTSDYIAEGIDIRGDGGYVIIPPSKNYHWEISNPDEPAEMLEWLIELANQKKSKSRNRKQRNKRGELNQSIKRKGKSYYDRLPVTQKFHDFPIGQYVAEFVGWTVLESNAFILKDGDVRIEMRFKVFASDRYFYISSFHLISILKAPKMFGQMQTGRGAGLATSLNNIIGGIADDGFPIVINLNDVDFDVFLNRQLVVTVGITKRAIPPYAHITLITHCCS